MKTLSEYALYRGDELLGVGTVRTLAKELGYEQSYIKWLKTPTYKKRVAARKYSNRAMALVEIEDDV